MWGYRVGSHAEQTGTFVHSKTYIKRLKVVHAHTEGTSTLYNRPYLRGGQLMGLNKLHTSKILGDTIERKKISSDFKWQKLTA